MPVVVCSLEAARIYRPCFASLPDEISAAHSGAFWAGQVALEHSDAMGALRQEGEEEKKALNARIKELESSLESARFVDWACSPVACLCSLSACRG